MMTSAGFVRACTVEELAREGRKAIQAGGRAVLLLHEQGRVVALDNRCPHMGFPLHRGSVRDGILTCHWHHAKFDLASGCTFDLFADDATTFPVELRDGEVWIDPRPPADDGTPHWLQRVEDGLEHQVDLVLAKSAIRLAEGAFTDAVRRAALFGLRNRADGWSQGMTILTCVASVRLELAPEDRPLALFQGLLHVGRSSAGQHPDFPLEPLAAAGRDPATHLGWFRHFVEVREHDAAERALATAIADGLRPPEVAELVFAACTDHLFLTGGHVLDFANKAFELLDLIGWEHAQPVLTSLVPMLVEARRHEEVAEWRHPVDVAALVQAASRSVLDTPADGAAAWLGHRDLAELCLGDDPEATLDEITGLLRRGVPAVELADAISLAAVLRAVRFPTSNEISDWETVLHAFTYANAVEQALRRSPSPLIVRGVLDAAMAVYLERFLNVPPRAAPKPGTEGLEPNGLLDALDSQAQVDRCSQLVMDAAAGGKEEQIVSTLGHALLREDASFHQFQMFEAGVRLWRRHRGTGPGALVLVGVARYLAAHYPTMRAAHQTFDIAQRLRRGEALHEDPAPAAG